MYLKVSKEGGTMSPYQSKLGKGLEVLGFLGSSNLPKCSRRMVPRIFLDRGQAEPGLAGYE